MLLDAVGFFQKIGKVDVYDTQLIGGDHVGIFVGAGLVELTGGVGGFRKRILEVGAAQIIDHSGRTFPVGAVLDHCAGGAAGSVAFGGVDDPNVGRTVIDQGQNSVFVGHTYDIFTLVNTVIAGGGAGRGDAVHVVDQLGDIVPCGVVFKAAEQDQHGNELTPCRRGNGGVAGNDLALQFRLKKVSVAVDGNAGFGKQLGVDNEAVESGIGPVVVVAVRVNQRTLVYIGAGVRLIVFVMLGTVVLTQTAEDDISLGIAGFGFQAGIRNSSLSRGPK